MDASVSSISQTKGAVDPRMKKALEDGLTVYNASIEVIRRVLQSRYDFATGQKKKLIDGRDNTGKVTRMVLFLEGRDAAKIVERNGIELKAAPDVESGTIIVEMSLIETGSTKIDVLYQSPEKNQSLLEYVARMMNYDTAMAIYRVLRTEPEASEEIGGRPETPPQQTQAIPDNNANESGVLMPGRDGRPPAIELIGWNRNRKPEPNQEGESKNP
ncbi:MAG: hypothetical protein M1504_00040 [Candidatus Marsarchaeota archaeon]|nr:hypothetical protein [Candidatus Marsarchaeota archaeon]